MNENYKIELLIAILKTQIASNEDKESYTSQTLQLVLNLANEIKNLPTFIK
jgi:hypothetical protein